jgi:hypothetical protein
MRVDLSETGNHNKDLLLVGTPEIEIPKKMLYINKKGKEQVINTLRQDGNIAKRNSEPVILFNPVNKNELSVVKQGVNKSGDNKSYGHVVAIRDKTIESLQRQIADRKKLLSENGRKLNIIVNENEYLSEISDDYQKYFQYIKSQKENQIKAFDLIYKYLERLIKSSTITEREMDSAIREQREILEKINNIKDELDDIINEHK